MESAEAVTFYHAMRIDGDFIQLLRSYIQRRRDVNKFWDKHASPART